MFSRHFLAPIVIIVISAMVTLFGGLLWFTELQDNTEAAREQKMVAAVFAARVDELQAANEVFSVWDDAARMLVLRFDARWADINIGQYTFEQYQIETNFIVDASGRPIYAFLNGKRAGGDPESLLGSGYAKAMHAMLTVPSMTTAAVSGISLARAGPVIFSISRVRPHTNAINVFAAATRYVVMAKVIDDAVVAALSKTAHGPPLALTVDRRGGSPGSFSIHGFDGRHAGTLAWQPAKPGTELYRKAMPWLGLLALMMTLLASAILRRARQATRVIETSEKTAIYQSNHDQLTGLPNRRAITDHLLAVARDGGDYSILYLDLDGFKEVNDSLGHGVGDQILRHTAERLQKLLPANAFLARLGGDEFAITLCHNRLAETFDRLADDIVAAARAPHNIGGVPIVIGVSIGIANSNGAEYEDVLRRADLAMYTAKARGRDGWCLFETSLDEGRLECKALEADLRRAVGHGDITVVFQPIVRVKDGRITAVEALARWNHPTRGPISPDIFIPIAEDSGLIVGLSQQVLRAACIAARDWPVDLTVNLSPAQFWDQSLVEHVMATIGECGFPPRRLSFEITETYLLRRPEAAAAIITDLRRRGIRIALDDFGTGYASIGFLRKFEFDLVKIDRSLVDRIAHDRAAVEVVTAVMALCRALRLPTLAEGVETADQARLLTAADCTYMQGWHFGHPAPAVKIDALFRDAVARAA